MVPIYKIIRVYEYLYSKRQALPTYTLTFDNIDLKLLSRFQKEFEDRDGSFVWDYSVFAFSIYSHFRETKDRKVNIRWIYGPKMWNRYRNKTKANIYFAQEYKEKLNLFSPLVSRKIEGGLSERYLNEQRKKYWNTIQGYLNCADFGTFLYDESNVYCKNCRYKERCKDVKSEL